MFFKNVSGSQAGHIRQRSAQVCLAQEFGTPDRGLPHDYRVTFGVAASCFAANMSVKQNALDNELSYPLAFQAVMESFYVDDELTMLSRPFVLEMSYIQTLFHKGGFHLRKWNSNSPLVLQTIPKELWRSSQYLYPRPSLCQDPRYWLGCQIRHIPCPSRWYVYTHQHYEEAIALRHFQSVRCHRVVCTNNHPYEDFTSTDMGAKSWMGRLNTRKYFEYLASLNETAVAASHPKVLCSQWKEDSTLGATRFLRCFRGGICLSSLSVNYWPPITTHLSGCSEDKSKKLTTPRLELRCVLTVIWLIQHAREILSLTHTFGLTAPSC